SAVATSIVVGAVVLLWTVYRRTTWPARLRWTAGLLKGAAFALIAACLLEPLWSATRAAPGENLVLVVVDSSASLQVGDGPDGAPRSAEFAAVLSDEQLEWQIRLGQDFRVRRYALSD